MILHTEKPDKKLNDQKWSLINDTEDIDETFSGDRRASARRNRQQGLRRRRAQIRHRLILALAAVAVGGAAAIYGFMILDARGMLEPGQLGKELAKAGVPAETSTQTQSQETSGESATEGIEGQAGSTAASAEGAGTGSENADLQMAVPEDDTDYGTGEITIAVPSDISGLIGDEVELYTSKLPGMADMKVTVTEEDDIAVAGDYNNPDELADIYVFQSEDEELLEKKGLLAADSSFPLTWDGGYFLYYDSTVIQDPSSLEGILEDCASAGRTFNMDLTSGWYQLAFFLGAGCTVQYQAGEDGSITASEISLASDSGVAAFKAMLSLAGNDSFASNSVVALADNPGAVVSGIWDRSAAEEAFGNGYAAARLPLFQVDGTGYQMGSLVEGRKLGVKPQTEELKQQACDALAAWLSSADGQLAIYRKAEWIPADETALESAELSDDPAVQALTAQNAAGTVRGVMPQAFWSFLTAFGDNILAGQYDGASDSDLLTALQGLETNCTQISQAGN